MALTGVPPAGWAAACTALALERPAPVTLVVTETEVEAERIAAELPLPLALAQAEDSVEVLWLPSLPETAERRPEHLEQVARRLTVLERLGRLSGAGPRLVLAASVPALAAPLPSPTALSKAQVSLRLNQTLAPRDLIARLRELDYDAEPQCEAPGQYAQRGGLVDVYPVTADAPVRIDFFGDTIEDIREYDPATQRSGGRLETVTIAAAPTVVLEAAPAGLASHLGPRANFILLEPGRIDVALSAAARAELEAVGGGAAGGAAMEPPEGTFLERHFRRARPEADDRWAGVAEFEADGACLPEGQPRAVGECLPLSHLRGREGGAGPLADSYWEQERASRARFLAELAAWQAAGDRIVFVFPREGEEQRAREILRDEAPAALASAEVRRGLAAEGCRFLAPEGPGLAWPGLDGARGLVLVTEAEFFGRRLRPRVATRRKSRKVESQVDQMLDFSELAEGDLVVHLHHGIGLFRGVRTVDSQGARREAIAIEFEEQVTFYVPFHEAHLVTRYVGLSKTRPPLGKIGSGRWEKTRQAAERAALDLAGQLLATQAARDARTGHAFPPDATWQHEFEATFPYKETPDQLRSIQEVKADMEKPRSMDRLVCGDVGFGKTEVAIRAAFKAVMGGRQVAVLVPTTVLAQQHLNNFRERMAGFPVTVDMLNRFRTPAEQRAVVQAVAAGKVDILIGTHRILSADIAFRDLGLVVIDEEQRFGVRHKERFKQLRETVDVITMSATPIPRTLYLALAGARDLSVIETPPAERLPIRTIVKSFDLAVVIEAIRFEIRRGGQVFYLHNRVGTIESIAARLREALPELSIAVGHGQMHEHQLERVMTEFVAGRHQVLVCTTIIESGIDIPNCNTILIEHADRFGLSQLYQIRGRVGRFREQAYAYLLLHRHARLLDAARQRLNAIRQYNQLGAGFRIAMRDLELRGAGNLLGPQQSGHIAGVGFDLYCQLLRQSVARLKGEKSARWVRCTLKLDFLTLGAAGEGTPGEGPAPSGSGPVALGYLALREADDGDGRIPAIEARLPFEYIGETRLRLDLYRRLAMAGAVAAVREIEQELIDRFGPFDNRVRALLLATEVRCRAEQKGIQTVETQGARLKCLRASGRADDLVMAGTRFPRLTERDGLGRLREISLFLNNLPDA